MALTDLRFRQGPLTTPPIDLVFGGVGGPPPAATATLDVDAVLPKVIRGYGAMAVVQKLDVDAVLPKVIRGYGEMEYQSRTHRDIGPSISSKFQQAIQTDNGLRVGRFQQALPLLPTVSVVGAEAVPLQTSVEVRQQDALRLDQPLRVIEQEAIPLMPPATAVRWQEALRSQRPTEARYQDAIPLVPPPTKIRFQEALRSSVAANKSKFQDAVPLYLKWLSKLQNARRHAGGKRVRYQDAIQPREGRTPPTVPPGQPDPCYIPPPGDQVHLRFWAPWTNNTNLLFVCERHDGEEPPPSGDTIVVPIRKTYIVINATSMTLDDGTPLYGYGSSLAIDVDSYTWSFNAQIYFTELSKVLPDNDGVPVTVRLLINGEVYRMVVEKVSETRKFADVRYNISGRGLTAALDAPYSPVMNFGNEIDRTANQLMEDVLLDNGVPMDWTVDWQLDDWTVPAGAWRFAGTRMAALQDIVGAAGGYIQTHANMSTIIAKHRYPVAPWDWNSVTPAYEIPADPISAQNRDWVEKPRYNRVYVSGIGQGILGQVTREGTAGDRVAEMVSHALITEAVAARQRGIAVLGDTGRIVTFTLSLPILPETGIILPGTFINYTEGAAERIGITRSVNVDVRFPEVQQTITLETQP